MVPVVPNINSIISGFTFQLHRIASIMSLYFRISSASFSITFLSPEVNTHVPSSLSRIMMSGLLFGMVLSVCIC